MKIAFLLVDLSGRGGERAMLTLANEFAKHDHDVDLLLLQKKGSFHEYIHEKLNVHIYNSSRILFALPRLVFYLITKRPRILVATSVHTHTLALIAKTLAFSGVHIAARIGIPLSKHFANFSSKKDAFVKKYILKNLQKAKYLLPNSKGIAKHTAALLKIPPDRFTTVYSPIDIEEIKRKSEVPIEHEWFADDVPVISTIGSLRKQKDHATLIRALSKMKHNARLMIIGEGSEKRALEELIRKLNLSARVELVGYNENPYHFVKHSDVFALSSLHEGFPNVLLEAMVCGVPIVSTDCEYGPRELLSDADPFAQSNGVEKAKYGILVPVQNDATLAEALDELVSESALRDQYREKGLERVQEYSSDRIYKQYAETFS